MRGQTIMKRFITGLMVGAVLLLNTPVLNTQAAQTEYTVTFRPGNVGYFALAESAASEKKDLALEVAQQLYSGNSNVTAIQTTDNGAIKLTVAKGAAIPAAPEAGYIHTEEGYFVKNASEWGPAAEALIKNVDYVVDYGRLVDGVEYTVRYVDASSEASIAPVTIAYANVGDTVEIAAPANLTISGATYYALANQASQSIVLSADRTANVITFTYSAQPAETVINEVIEYIDGGTVVTTEVVQVPGQPADTTTGGTGGAGAVLAPGQQDDAADVDAEEDGDVTDIQEEETPLEEEIPSQEENETGENTTEDDQNGIVEIEDDTVALSEAPGGNSALYVGAGVAAAFLAAVGAIWIKKSRQVQNTTEE